MNRKNALLGLLILFSAVAIAAGTLEKSPAPIGAEYLQQPDLFPVAEMHIGETAPIPHHYHAVQTSRPACTSTRRAYLFRPRTWRIFRRR
jgi:hypothetical protein